MSIFDELTEEIMTWLDDDQDPECIKKDIMRTVEEAINARDDRKYKTDIARTLQEYTENKYGDFAKEIIKVNEYLELAGQVLKSMDETMGQLKKFKGLVDLFKDLGIEDLGAKENVPEEDTPEVEKAAAPQTEEDKDAHVIEEFLASIDAWHKAATGGAKVGRSGVPRRSNNPFDF